MCHRGEASSPWGASNSFLASLNISFYWCTLNFGNGYSILIVVSPGWRGIDVCVASSPMRAPPRVMTQTFLCWSSVSQGSAITVCIFPRFSLPTLTTTPCTLLFHALRFYSIRIKCVIGAKPLNMTHVSTIITHGSSTSPSIISSTMTSKSSTCWVLSGWLKISLSIALCVRLCLSLDSVCVCGSFLH